MNTVPGLQKDKVNSKNKPSTPSEGTAFVVNDTSEQVKKYIDEICSDPKFLCSNKDLCGKSTAIYTNPANVDKICKDMEKANECENDVKECVVSTENLFDDSHGNVTTSFVNIILPIPNAFDEKANQKFLRLPALSASKKPKSEDICKICACMNRFSTSPGSSAVINETSYTSPGQNTCMYPDFIEHYYYPLNIQSINTKLPNTPPVKLGKYTVINSNIIFAHSEEELLIPNLYDLLIKNGIAQQTAISFITKVLHKNDEAKVKELELYIMGKSKNKENLKRNGVFYQNIAFFYGILVVLLLLFFL
jgi:hypothetical protein